MQVKLATLPVTARGQVTFRKDILRHLCIQPGDRNELDKLPDGRVTLKAARPAGTVEDFIGLPADTTTRVATLEEIPPGGGKRLGRFEMKVTVDTTILIRVVMRDERQAAVAIDLFRSAELIALPLPSLCVRVDIARGIPPCA